MFTPVMDGGKKMPFRLPLTGASVWVRAFLMALVASLSWGIGSAAGQGDNRPAFKASIVDVSRSVERLTVPLWNSVTVETNAEITRADVTASQIADVDIISPTRVLIKGQKYGSTTLILHTANDEQYVYEISVELDVARLNEAIRTIDPLAKAEARSVLGHIVLAGTVSSTERANRIVELAKLFLPPHDVSKKLARTVQNHLEVAGEQQVLLRCVVAEVNRAASSELGINGYLMGENFRDAFMVQQLGGINPVNIGAAASAIVTENVPFFTDTNGLILRETPTLSLGFPRVQMQLFLKAMADNSLLKILAEPNLVAISGETATFLAGGEFPIPVPQGNQQVTIEFREFGVRLNFTPIVIGQQRIRLRVAPEISELDFSVAIQIEGFVVPGLTSRATETTVELGNGETIAIAGLLNEQIRGLSSRIPGLGDVPILGALFRSVSYRRSLTELVVLVTPEIVAPLDAHQKFALPGEGMEVPGAYELYASGLLEGATKTAGGIGPDDVGDDIFGLELDSEPEELAMHGPWGHVRP